MSKELTSKMKRSALIAVLRDRRLWPEGFEWYFGSCDTCAMGLAREVLGAERANSAAVAKAIGILHKHALNLFVPMRDVPSRNKFKYEYGEITPEMVAERLEGLHREMEEEDGE